MKKKEYAGIISPSAPQFDKRRNETIEFSKGAGKSPDIVFGISKESSRLDLLKSKFVREGDFERTGTDTYYVSSEKSLGCHLPKFEFYAANAGFYVILREFVNSKEQEDYLISLEDDCRLRNNYNSKRKKWVKKGLDDEEASGNPQFNWTETIESIENAITFYNDTANDSLKLNFGIVQLGNSGVHGPEKISDFANGSIAVYSEILFHADGSGVGICGPWRSGSQCLIFSREAALEFYEYWFENIHSTSLQKSKKFRETPLDQIVWGFVKKEKKYREFLYWAKTFQDRKDNPSQTKFPERYRKPDYEDEHEWTKHILFTEYFNDPIEVSKWVHKRLKKPDKDLLHQWLDEASIERKDFFLNSRRTKICL
jgi:hypothetical protein